MGIDESGAEDIFDVVHGGLDTFAAVDVGFAVAELDGFVVAFGCSGWY